MGSCILDFFVVAAMVDLFMIMCGSWQMDTLLDRGIELYINVTELHLRLDHLDSLTKQMAED